MAEHRRDLLLDRVVFFSDAVFAIAATLLVLDLRPPVTSDADYEVALQHYLVDPTHFIGVVIGFLVVGAYWVGHRRIFSLVDSTTGLIIWANLFFLFFVAIQPFVAAALAEHEPNVTSVITYAGAQVLTGLAQLVLWAAIVRSPTALIPTATPALLRYVAAQLLRAPIVFLVSIPITLIAGPTAGMLSWSLVFILIAVVARVFGNPEGTATQPEHRA